MDHTTLIRTERSELWVVPRYIADTEAHDLLQRLLDLELTHHPSIKVFGKHGVQRRDVGFFSDVSEGYRYSTYVSSASPFMQCPGHEWMDRVNHDMGADFNGILVKPISRW